MRQEELKRTLGLPALAFYGTGIIIGAGIYSVIGAAAAEAGEALWMGFLVSEAIALFTGLSYAELTTMYPEAGAEYVYLREAAPRAPSIAFLLGVILVLAGSATASAVAQAFASYMQLFVDLPGWIFAGVLIAACSAVAIAGITESSWVNIAFTSIEIGGLLLIVGAGAGEPRFGDALTATPDSGVITAAALLFFVYLGFEEIANLAGEAKNTSRDLPRAILISLGVTTLLYVLVALASVALVSPDAMAASESSMAVVARAVSPLMERLLSAIALFATANTSLIAIIATSRIIYAMARDRQLPERLGDVLPKRRTPWVATLVVAAIAIALLPLGTVATTASVSSLASLLAFVVVNVAVVVLRHRQPDHERPFRVPFTIGRTPILSVLGAATGLALATQFDAIVYLVCAGAAVVGILGYVVKERSRRA